MDIFNIDLLSPLKTTATPAAGTYNEPTPVVLTANRDADIYYTTDGSEPTTCSSIYSSPLLIENSTTIKFFAADKIDNREITRTSVYSIEKLATATPVFSAIAGKYPMIIKTRIDSTDGAVIKYTDDGSDPRTSSTVKTYMAEITIAATTTLKAYAYKYGWIDSGLAKAEYIIDARMVDYGMPGVTGVFGYGDITTDSSDGYPIIIYPDSNNGNKARIQKWQSGDLWNDLGNASEGGVYHCKIRCDPSDNKPIVAFVDLTNNYRARIKKWSSGTSWTDLGYASSGITSWISLAVRSDGTPAVSYRDYDNGYKARAMGWESGTIWSDLGFASTGNADYIAMAMDTDGCPILIFSDGDDDNKARVMKWSGGTAWTDLGIVSDGAVESPTNICIDTSDGKPVVIFLDRSMSDKYRIKKWDSGIQWTDLGTVSNNFSSSSPSMAIGSDNKPVIMFRDGNYNNRMRLFKWDTGTVWSDLGLTTTSESYGNSMVYGGENSLFLLVSEINNDYKWHVYKH